MHISNYYVCVCVCVWEVWQGKTGGTEWKLKQELSLSKNAFYKMKRPFGSNKNL